MYDYSYRMIYNDWLHYVAYILVLTGIIPNGWTISTDSLVNLCVLHVAYFILVFSFYVILLY